MAACENCGGTIAYGKCRECGSVASTAAPGVKADASRLCPFDGGNLRADGYCERGDGFPITLKECPDVCPHCRRSLAWSGDCYHCRPEGEKPGHLYDDEKGHWRIVERGPQPLAPATVALEAMRQVAESLAIVERRITAARGGGGVVAP